MRLCSLTLENIGIFADAKVELGRRAAVIAGKNNSGKTSLLKAIAMQAPAEIPRTAAMLELPQAQRADFHQRLEWEFEVERADLEEVGRSQGHVEVPLLLGKLMDPLISRRGGNPDRAAAVEGA